MEQTHQLQFGQRMGLSNDITLVAPPKKQKEKGGGVVSGYKQATPTGFGDLRAKQNLSRPVKDVGNDKRFNVGLISRERSSPEGTAETARECQSERETFAQSWSSAVHQGLGKLK